MKNRRLLLQISLSTVLAFSLILPVPVAGASAAVPMSDYHSITHSAVDNLDVTSTVPPNTPQGNVTPMIAIGGYHTVGLKSDGTVVAVGDNSRGQCDVSGWTGIVQVAAGGVHTVGLKSDGTVVAVGNNSHGQCDVNGWTGIVQVAAGSHHTVGLKSDGTVVAVGGNSGGQCDVGGWKNIVQVAAGGAHTVGLNSDGTVVAVAEYYYGEREVRSWTSIVQVSTGSFHMVGLKSDGTVVAVGSNDVGQCDIEGRRWRDVVQVSAGYVHTVGFKNDGTAIAAGPDIYGALDVRNWTDIVQVAAGLFGMVGLRSDGTMVVVGLDVELGQWNLGTVTEYTLTISSAGGGSVTTPGQELSNYNAGAMVHLVAEPDAGHRFVNWTGDVGTIFNANAASTVIAMSDNYSITANFGEKPPINWPLIGGIIAGMIAAGLAVFFVRRGRAAQTTGG